MKDSVKKNLILIYSPNGDFIFEGSIRDKLKIKRALNKFNLRLCNCYDGCETCMDTIHRYKVTWLYPNLNQNKHINDYF